ncbi:MAG: hypothetical protein ACP5GX_06595, partial [Anaerolineae bacterium]
YLEELTERVLRDPTFKVHNQTQAGYFAQALVLAALFNPEERELFTRLYERRATLTDDERNAEIEELCERQGEEHLCEIIDRIFAAKREDQALMHYIMQAIEDNLWQPVLEEIKERRFKTEHFLWEVRG